MTFLTPSAVFWRYWTELIYLCVVATVSATGIPLQLYGCIFTFLLYIYIDEWYYMNYSEQCRLKLVEKDACLEINTRTPRCLIKRNFCF